VANTLFAPANAKRNGIVLILLTGLIHLALTPEYWGFAPYLGLLFVANAVGAGISVYGIYRGEFTWGWGLGLLVAGGAFVMYLISRTVGLQGIPDYEMHFSVVGILTMIIEVLFVVMFFRAFAGRSGAVP